MGNDVWFAVEIEDSLILRSQISLAPSGVADFRTSAGVYKPVKIGHC